jgi:hypothetical protein
MFSPVGGGRAFERRPAFQRRTCGLRNPRLTRLTDQVSSIYRDGSSTERRIQGGTRSGRGQRPRKYTSLSAFTLWPVRVLHCRIHFGNCCTTYERSARQDESSQVVTIELQAAGMMPGGQRDVKFDASRRSRASRAHSRTCEALFVGAFQSSLGCMHETRSRAAAKLGVCTTQNN